MWRNFEKVIRRANQFNIH
ncbi:MAG: hypothetical protein EOM59_10080 [Clostridia bacterium]|nr:hypothetical protein [Clostridia bacterium]